MASIFTRPLPTLCVIVLTAMLLACAKPVKEEQGPLVLAASSLQESLTAVADAWEAKGHATPRLSFAGSSTLARQLLNGAPADLFISADEEWMDRIEEAGLVKGGTRATLVGNRLVMIAPRDNDIDLDLNDAGSLAAALGTNRLAMADPDSVPAGRYGKAALQNLGIWPSVANRIAPAENVRAALALVERGQAPLGIVYATDARASDKVSIVTTLPATNHPPIRYPVAQLANSSDPHASAFLAFLASDEASAIFRRFGFEKADR